MHLERTLRLAIGEEIVYDNLVVKQTGVRAPVDAALAAVRFVLISVRRFLGYWQLEVG